MPLYGIARGRTHRAPMAGRRSEKRIDYGQQVVSRRNRRNRIRRSQNRVFPPRNTDSQTTDKESEEYKEKRRFGLRGVGKRQRRFGALVPAEFRTDA